MFLPSWILIIIQSSFGVWCVVQSRVLMRYIDLRVVIIKWRRLVSLAEVRLEALADAQQRVALGDRC